MFTALMLSRASSQISVLLSSVSTASSQAFSRQLRLHTFLFLCDELLKAGFVDARAIASDVYCNRNPLAFCVELPSAPQQHTNL